MSDRKGGIHKTKRKAVKIDVESHAELKEYTDTKKDADMGDVLKDFIAKGIKYDIFGDTWIDLDLDPETQAKLLKYAQSKKIPRTVIVAQFVAQGVEYDISDENWIKKLLKAKQIKDGYASKGDCDGLAYSVDEKGIPVYTCVWYREGRPPQIRILGHFEELQQARCAACGETEKIAKEFKERDLRIIELEVELGSKSSERLKIPKCNRGAVLNHDKEDRLIFTGCFRLRGEPVSVNKFCRIQSNGLPCAFFAELTVGVGAKKT